MLTQGANFAFHALMRMAQAGPGHTVSVEEMAASLGASPSYMAKLFQRLVHAGLLASQRGRGGGYSLARPPEDVTLGAILAALQESPAETLSLPSCQTCPLASACPIKEAMSAAQERVEQVLGSITAAGMAALAAQPVGP